MQRETRLYLYNFKEIFKLYLHILSMLDSIYILN